MKMILTILLLSLFMTDCSFKRHIVQNFQRNINDISLTDPSEQIGAGMTQHSNKKITSHRHHYFRVREKKLTAETMKHLYNTELYRAFYNYLSGRGIQEYYIPRLFCIAKLESNFDPNAVNFNKNGSIDVGLLQINTVWQKKCGMSLHNIETNISCAKIVLEKQGLNAWVTYQKWGGLCEKSIRI